MDGSLRRADAIAAIRLSTLNFRPIMCDALIYDLQECLKIWKYHNKTYIDVVLKEGGTEDMLVPNVYFDVIELLRNYVTTSNTINSDNSAHQTDEMLILPSELDIPVFRNALLRAEAEGWFERTENGGKWKLGNVRLGYICAKCFNPPRPYNRLEEFFGVKKLSSSIYQAEEEPKRADVKKWRKEIDLKIFHSLK